jgi:hypothetical protein
MEGTDEDGAVKNSPGGMYVLLEFCLTAIGDSLTAPFVTVFGLTKSKSALSRRC